MTDGIEQTAKEPKNEGTEKEATKKVDVSALGTETESAPEKKKTKVQRKGKAKRQVSQGKAYIQATFNNTIITITDLNGNVLTWSSAGACGFKGPKKATPYAASLVVKKVMEKLEPFGVHEVNVYVSGVGQGRDSAVRSLNAHGLAVLSMKDVTPIPHNGCRKPRQRRV